MHSRDRQSGTPDMSERKLSNCCLSWLPKVVSYWWLRTPWRGTLASQGSCRIHPCHCEFPHSWLPAKHRGSGTWRTSNPQIHVGRIVRRHRWLMDLLTTRRRVKGMKLNWHSGYLRWAVSYFSPPMTFSARQDLSPRCWTHTASELIPLPSVGSNSILWNSRPDRRPGDWTQIRLDAYSNLD